MPSSFDPFTDQAGTAAPSHEDSDSIYEEAFNDDDCKSLSDEPSEAAAEEAEAAAAAAEEAEVANATQSSSFDPFTDQAGTAAAAEEAEAAAAAEEAGTAAAADESLTMGWLTMIQREELMDGLDRLAAAAQEEADAAAEAAAAAAAAPTRHAWITWAEVQRRAPESSEAMKRIMAEAEKRSCPDTGATQYKIRR
jgi:hypothetical protein